jgi:hypothetical protein
MSKMENITYDDYILPLYRLLSNSILQIPKQWKNSVSFFDFIKKNLSDYNDLINDSSFLNEKEKKTTKILVDFLRKSLESYYLGKVLESNQSFNDFLILLFENYNTIIPNDSIFRYEVDQYLTERHTYFRAREIGKFSYKNYNKEQYYHVPFELRNKIGPKRFSIPGLPCLYLSTSAYTCWKELNRPNLLNFYFTMYCMSGKDLYLFDLTWSPVRIFYLIAHIVKNRENCNDGFLRNVDGLSSGLHKIIKNFLVSWPLNFVCSIYSEYKDDPFRPEYLFPQFLFQWIFTNRKKYRYEGIKYFSTRSFPSQDSLKKIFDIARIDPNNINFKYWIQSYQLNVNLALPIHTTKAKGWCDELMNRFHISYPVSIRNLYLRCVPESISINNSIYHKFLHGITNLMHSLQKFIPTMKKRISHSFKYFKKYDFIQIFFNGEFVEYYSTDWGNLELFIQKKEIEREKQIINEIKAELGDNTIDYIRSSSNSIIKIWMECGRIIGVYFSKPISNCNVIRKIMELKKIRTLWFNDYQLRRLPNEIDNLTYLKQFKIEKGLLESIPEFFGESPAFKSLIINDCKITEIPVPLAESRFLNLLNLDINQIRSIPIEFSDNLIMKSFSLQHNPLVLDDENIKSVIQHFRNLNNYFNITGAFLYDINRIVGELIEEQPKTWLESIYIWMLTDNEDGLIKRNIIGALEYIVKNDKFQENRYTAIQILINRFQYHEEHEMVLIYLDGDNPAHFKKLVREMLRI